ncbi:MAG: helix-turn-helix transcriptional regulator [Bacteroides sp.]|nr:helix-turn-helix transcriptional regulator [Bacteroides sp.]MDE6430851.1 helix-turn-helix transcriptional regulator [Duncaniella sp.]MDE6813909.1 helix-turn-helix transcriptional regulator [Duncaniella sp.]
MKRSSLVDAFDPKCPIRNILARFSEKWGLLVIYTLTLKPWTRFNELRKEIPDISARMLSATLNTLVADGLVERYSYNTVPPTVEYSLSEIGKTLVPYLESLIGWAKEYSEQIMNHRIETSNERRQ